MDFRSGNSLQLHLQFVATRSGDGVGKGQPRRARGYTAGGVNTRGILNVEHADPLLDVGYQRPQSVFVGQRPIETDVLLRPGRQGANDCLAEVIIDQSHRWREAPLPVVAAHAGAAIRFHRMAEFICGNGVPDFA